MPGSYSVAVVSVPSYECLICWLSETLEITLNGGDKDVSIKTKQSLLNYPPTKHSLFRQTAEKIEGSKQG